MDLMTATTTFAKLQQRYKNFGAPTVRITVDGTEITAKLEATIASLTVELTAGTGASGCSFDVIGEYEPKNSDFSSQGAAGLLQLGAKVEVELGYIETVPVFFGLISELEYTLDEEGAGIHVECADAKLLLMKSARLRLIKEKSIAQAIGELLGEQPFSAYIQGKKLELRGEKLDMLPAAYESDYQFISRHAERLGCEFFIVQGKVYLREQPSGGSPILTLSRDAGLLGLKLSLRGDALYKTMRVVGISPENDGAVSGEAALNGNFGKGPGPARMLAGTQRTLFDHAAASAQQAGARAKALLRNAADGFGRLECRCIGLPELVPGRSIKVEGVSAGADREGYILEVRHTLDGRGFFTTLEAKVVSL